MSQSEGAQACAVRLAELRRWWLEELPALDAERMRVHTHDCARCTERIQALEDDRAAHARLRNPAAESAAILERLDRAPSTWRALFSRPVWAAGVALVALVALVPLAGRFGREDPTTRAKGTIAASPERAVEPAARGPTLEMYVKDGSVVRRGREGERLHEGDRIQFRYRADGRHFVLVLSIDARGAITPLYPNAETESIAVEPEGTHVLEGSTILDDAVGPERIYAFFSDVPLTYAELAKHARARLARETDLTSLRALDLEGKDVSETSILIFKEPRP